MFVKTCDCVVKELTIRQTFSDIQEEGLECTVLSPFPKRQILKSSKMKEFADDNLELDENNSKFSQLVENTVGKGEIARCKEFFLFT